MLANLFFLAADAGHHIVRDVVLIAICLLVCGYLLAALLWPEKF